MPLTGKEMLKLYKKHGWRIVRQKGSHYQLKKTLNGVDKLQTIPVHSGDLKKGLEQRLLKEI